jgi:predicted AAA+ superfamily ATPase
MKRIDNGRTVNILSIMMKITVYTGVMQDEIVREYSRLIRLLSDQNSSHEELLAAYHRVLSMLIRRYGTNGQIFGDLWKNHLIDLILADENVFSLACEKGEFKSIPKPLLNIVKTDLKYLYSLFCLDGKAVGDIMRCRMLVEDLPGWELRAQGRISSVKAEKSKSGNTGTHIVNTLFESVNWELETDALNTYYYKQGCGMFGRYKAFRWIQTNHTGFLEGVENPDPIRLADLIDYERERSVVIQNTLQFIRGLPCNNILLYGDRGTGKSATVKAILNEFAHLRLSLVEVSKYHLNSLPQVMEHLQNRGRYFILFIDDLSFEDDESSYRELKSILEGGIEAKPQNVVIYATSNRRHLIKEYFSERSLSDEVSSQDTMQEKLSLSDRFGITVTFTLPDKETYLRIVEGLAGQRGLDIDPDELKAEAIKWEMLYNGRSPRTARQFIDHMEGKLKYTK